MTPVESLRQQLEQYQAMGKLNAEANGWKTPFLNMQDLLLKRGRLFFPSARRRKTVPRACFYQTYRLTQRRGSPWVYCEGYAVGPGGLAVHHAWAMHSDERAYAVELAWDDADLGSTAYMGIPFKREFVRETYLAGKRKEFGVLDAWWMSHPLLTGARRLEDVVWNP